MNPLPQIFEHRFYPEGQTEDFFISFNTNPSKPDIPEDSLNQNIEALEKENSFHSKTWTKTTNSWA